MHVRGTVLPEGVERDVVVTGDGRFDLEGTTDAPTILEGVFLMPGLVDAHCHLGLFSPAGDEAPDDERARASAEMELATGVLALREPGGPNRASTGLGPSVGLPRTFAAGRTLTAPGRYVPGLGRPVIEDGLADACVEELRAGGGGWAKVIGDWAGPDGRYVPSFSAEGFAAAAAAVHGAGGRISVHATTPQTLDMAIAAGFDSIEHGLGMSERHIERMVAGGIAWVPTMSILQGVLPLVDSMGAPREVHDRIAASVEALPGAVRAAAEAGVLVLAGTDAGMIPHGLIRAEIAAIAAAGLSTEAALGSGSWHARAFLGLPGIEHRAPADLVAYARDPREDLGALDEPLLIVLDGRVVGGSAAPSR